MEETLSSLKKPGSNAKVQAVKFIFVLLVLPLLTGFVRGLLNEIFLLDYVLRDSFFCGVAVYLLLHILVIEPVKLYKKTQGFIQVIFGFFSPIFKLSYYIIPFWVIVLLAIYLVTGVIFKLVEYNFIFFFSSGFLFTMHIAMVAKMLKPDQLHKVVDYLFIICAVIVINIFLLALNLKLYDPAISIIKIARAGLDFGVNIFKVSFNQLFVP